MMRLPYGAWLIRSAQVGNLRVEKRSMGRASEALARDPDAAAEA